MADVELDIDVLGNAERALDEIADRADRAADDIERLDRLLGELGGDANIDLDTTQIEEQLRRLRRELEDPALTRDRRIEIEVDIDNAERELRRLRDAADGAGRGVASAGSGGSAAMAGLVVAGALVSAEVVGLGAVAVVSGAVMVASFKGVTEVVALLNQRTGQATEEQKKLDQQIQASFSQMSEGGKAFALELSHLEQGPLKQLQIAAQDGFMQGITKGLKDSEQPLRDLTPLVAAFSKSLGDLIGPMIPDVVNLAKAFTSFANDSLKGLKDAGIDKALHDMTTNLAAMFTEMVESGDAQKAMAAVVDIVEALADPEILEFALKLSADFASIVSAAANVISVFEKILGLIDDLSDATGGSAGFVLGTVLSAMGFGVGGMAEGGTVASAGWSWVGEEGPELRYEPQGASIIPLPRLGEMGGGSVTNNTYNVSGVIGPAASVVTALRSANVQTRRRGYGGGIS